MSVPWSYVMKSIMLLTYRITKRSVPASKLQMELTVYQKLIREYTVCVKSISCQTGLRLSCKRQNYYLKYQMKMKIMFPWTLWLVGSELMGSLAAFRTHNPSVARHHHFPRLSPNLP
jgi:hypothetical protein